MFYENVKFLNTFILVFTLHVLWTELLMFKVLYEMDGGFLMFGCGFVARTLCWRIIELSFHSSLYCFQHCEEVRAYEHSNIICWWVFEFNWIVVGWPSTSGRSPLSLLVRTSVWICVFLFFFFLSLGTVGQIINIIINAKKE